MRRLCTEELLDEPGQPTRDVADSLRDVRRVNRFLGGTAVTLHYLKALIGPGRRAETVLILDIATGSGDIPRAVARWARRRGCRVEYVGLDVNPAVLAVARQMSTGYPEIRYVPGDARRTGFDDACFDYVTCSLALHHFDPPDAANVLREMDRLSRKGFVVNDLRRSRIACGLIWLLTRLLRANRLTRHDGPVSTLRAYTPRELEDMAARAGIRDARVRRHAFFRMALVVRKPSGDASLGARPSAGLMVR